MRDLFGNSVIASSGIGTQMPLFHEPNPADEIARKQYGSREANRPDNTGELFNERKVRDVTEGHGKTR